MDESPSDPNPPKNGDGFGYFILASICAFPFVVISFFLVAGIVTGHSPRGDSPLMVSLFFLPLFLVATICGIIFIVMAWKNNHRRFRPVLTIYLIAIFLYWAVLLGMGPI